MQYRHNRVWIPTWEGKIVVSSCAHDGPMGATGVKRLKSIEMIDSVPRMNALDMNTAEDAIVRMTREIVPDMIVTGMKIAEIDGAPRMEPTFGAMMISRQKPTAISISGNNGSSTATPAFEYYSSKEMISIISEEGLRQLHIFIFVLALMHVIYSVLTMALGKARV